MGAIDKVITALTDEELCPPHEPKSTGHEPSPLTEDEVRQVVELIPTMPFIGGYKGIAQRVSTFEVPPDFEAREPGRRFIRKVTPAMVKEVHEAMQAEAQKRGLTASDLNDAVSVPE